MANDELDALNALEKEAKEYDKVWFQLGCSTITNERALILVEGCGD
jgi:hypothetical protein